MELVALLKDCGIARAFGGAAGFLPVRFGPKIQESPNHGIASGIGRISR
jgi:hypothetical protein